MRTIPYAYTVKKLSIDQAEQTYDMYDYVLNEGTRCQKLPYGLANGSERVYELDSKGKLHVHGIFFASISLRYSDVFCKGYHIFIRALMTLNDVKRWRNYLTKHPIDEDAFNYRLQEYKDAQCRAYFKKHPLYTTPHPELPTVAQV